MTDADHDGDILPIAHLQSEDGDGTAARRSLPALWIAIGVMIAIAVGAILLRAGNDERSPEERLAAAPGAVEAAKTFGYEVRAETSMGTFSSAFSLQGAVDVAGGRSRSTMDILGRKLELVTDGEVAYVQVPAESRGITQGKAWMKLPTAGLAGATGGASPTANPLDSFRQLAATGAEIENLGEEEVRGTSTTHYRTRLDLSKQAAGVGAVADDLSDVPVEVWLDEDDRPRRYKIDLQIDNPAQPGQKASVTTTMETFDYGKPVEIDVPAEGDIADVDPAALGSLFAPRLLMELAELQRVIEATYGERDRARGVPSSVAWLCEEVGELAKAARKGSRVEQLEELADVLAWTASLANQLGLSMDEAMARYTSGCPKCSRIPCSCPD